MMLTTYGLLLVMRERPMPVPGPGEIRLRVSACGIGEHFLWFPRRSGQKRKYRLPRSQGRLIGAAVLTM